MLGMSTKVGVLTVCTVLLATLAGRAAASPFGGESAYVALANHLHQATSSDKLEENIKQVGLLEVQQPDAGEELKELAQLFGSLKHNVDDPASLCSKDNLSNLRQLTEAMSRDGNLGPKKITEPIRRLNDVIIKFIVEIRPVCTRHLAADVPKTWELAYSDPDMVKYIQILTWITDLYPLGEGTELRDDFATTLSGHLNFDVIHDSAMSQDNNLMQANYMTLDEGLLTRQVEKYVHEPCRELMTFEVSKSAFEPYNELVRSWLLISGKNAMKEFYKGKEGFRFDKEKVTGYDRMIDFAVDRHWACTKLLPKPAVEIAKLVAKVRRSIIQSPDETKKPAFKFYQSIQRALGLHKRP